MINTVSFWKIVTIILSIWILADAIKQKRYLSGTIWAVASYFLPFLGFIYWTFGRNAQVQAFKQTSHQSSSGNSKKLCPKCGTENTSTNCTQCGNKLNL